MSSLVGGTGIIGQDMVCGFGKYKTFEGTEISIENCVKAKVKDLVVEGKTYQNLVSNLEELVGNVYTRDTVAIIDTSLFKANTTYTAIITISESNYSHEKYGAIFSIFYPTLTNGYVSISLKDGTFKLKFTTREETPSKIQVGVQYGNSATSSFKLNNLIVLEGDYTNIDLPNNINGIESVTEKENNVLSVKINDNTTTLNLPIPLRSLPNGTCDTIEGNTLVQRVGKVVYNGSEDWKLGVTTGNVPVFYLVSANLKGLSSLICDTYTVQTTTKDKSIYCGNAWRPQIRDDTCATVEDFKAYLTENPVTVYYELATPIIHSLEIPQLATTKGTNIITTTNNIKPNLKIKVKVK